VGDDQRSRRTRERNADPDCDKLDGSGRNNTSLGAVHHLVPSHFLSTTLEFLNGDPPNDNSNGLDNVVVTPGSVVSTPEPSTLLQLVLAAVCALGFYRIRGPVTQLNP
jgi:hypothetical protein